MNAFFRPFFYRFSFKFVLFVYFLFLFTDLVSLCMFIYTICTASLLSYRMREKKNFSFVCFGSFWEHLKIMFLLSTTSFKKLLWCFRSKHCKKPYQIRFIYFSKRHFGAIQFDWFIYLFSVYAQFVEKISTILFWLHFFFEQSANVFFFSSECLLWYWNAFSIGWMNHAKLFSLIFFLKQTKSKMHGIKCKIALSRPMTWIEYQSRWEAYSDGKINSNIFKSQMGKSYFSVLSDSPLYWHVSFATNWRKKVWNK